MAELSYIDEEITAALAPIMEKDYEIIGKITGTKDNLFGIMQKDGRTISCIYTKTVLFPINAEVCAYGKIVCRPLKKEYYFNVIHMEPVSDLKMDAVIKLEYNRMVQRVIKYDKELTKNGAKNKLVSIKNIAIITLNSHTYDIKTLPFGANIFLFKITDGENNLLQVLNKIISIKTIDLICIFMREMTNESSKIWSRSFDLIDFFARHRNIKITIISPHYLKIKYLPKYLIDPDWKFKTERECFDAILDIQNKYSLKIKNYYTFVNDKINNDIKKYGNEMAKIKRNAERCFSKLIENDFNEALNKLKSLIINQINKIMEKIEDDGEMILNIILQDYSKTSAPYIPQIENDVDHETIVQPPNDFSLNGLPQTLSFEQENTVPNEMHSNVSEIAYRYELLSKFNQNDDITLLDNDLLTF